MNPEVAETIANIALDEIAPEKKVPTDKEIRNLRRQFVTVRLPEVVACGHKFDPIDTPRHANCYECWFAYFQTHGEVTQTADEVFQKHGKKALEQIKGVKFTKYFLRFMAGLALALQGQNAEEHDTTGTSGSHDCCGEACDLGREAESNRQDQQGIEQAI